MVGASKAETGGGPIRYGMVGGGQGAFIGAVHRIAARMDNDFVLVAGALSSDPGTRQGLGRGTRARSGPQLWRPMPRWPRPRPSAPDGIEAVAIVTPNNVHVPAAKAFLEAGIHVICDKPLATTLAEAKKLAALVEKTGKVFVLTHNYTAYPMVRQAREMVAKGVLGDIRIVQSEYPQDWLTEDLAATGQKQAAWRSDPKQAGAGGATGRHRHACLQPRPLRLRAGARFSCRPISTPSCRGGSSTTTSMCMLRFKPAGKTHPAKGMIWASQVAPGHENGLKLRIYGSKGGLEWVQADPNYLWYTPFGQPKQLITRSGAGALPVAARVSAAFRRAIRKAISKASPTSTRRPHAPSARRAGRAASRHKDVVFPTIAGRRRRHGLHRGLREVVEEEWGVDEAVDLKGSGRIEGEGRR